MYKYIDVSFGKIFYNPKRKSKDKKKDEDK